MIWNAEPQRVSTATRITFAELHHKSGPHPQTSAVRSALGHVDQHAHPKRTRDRLIDQRLCPGRKHSQQLGSHPPTLGGIPNVSGRQQEPRGTVQQLVEGPGLANKSSRSRRGGMPLAKMVRRSPEGWCGGRRSGG